MTGNKLPAPEAVTNSPAATVGTAGGMTGDKLPALEAVRGVAALVVLAYHIVIAFAPPVYHDRGPIGTHVWQNGDLAVRVFFVLSGLVLTLKYFRTGDPAVLMSAAVRRYPRLLFPVAASVVLGFGLHAAGLMANTRAAELRPPEYREHPWLASVYRQELRPYTAAKEAFLHAFVEFRESDSYNGVLWSMEVEFTGSLFVFGLVAVIRPRQRRWVLYVVVLAVLVKYHYFFFLHILVGVILADVYVSRLLRPGWWALPLLPLGLVLGDAVGPLRHVGAPLVVAGAAFAPFWVKVLSIRPLLFLGRVSFCVYLFHMPVLFSLGTHAYCWVVDFGWGTPAAAWFAAVATTAGTIGLAYLGTITLDNWSIRFARWVDAKAFPLDPPPEVQPAPLES